MRETGWMPPLPLNGLTTRQVEELKEYIKDHETQPVGEIAAHFRNKWCVAVTGGHVAKVVLEEEACPKSNRS